MSCPFGFGNTKKARTNEGAVRSDIRSAIINKKVTACPIAVRLAWHASGTYQKSDNSGGSDGATMRFAPESTDGANAGLNIMRDMLLEIKEKHPEVSLADIWTYAGKVAVEESGGPKIPFSFGRSDEADGKKCPPNGRLPDATKGAAHLREVFHRMGHDDRDIVALSGGHTLGSCHKTRSGFDGPWTNNPLKFDNEYFTLLLGEEWVERKWDGPMQYADKKTGKLMMLPTDIALIKDEKFLAHVKAYAKDEQLFFKDFAIAFGKLLSNGVKENKKEPLTQKDIDSDSFRNLCMHGSTERAKAIAAKADVHEAEPGSGRNALHKAAFWGHNELCRWLIQDLKLKLDAQDYEGDTALIEASKYGHDNIVKMLLDAGAKKDIKNKIGRTALDTATVHKKDKVIALLK